MGLYRRDLEITPQDEMHLEVDHYLTPVDLDHELKKIYSHKCTSCGSLFAKQPKVDYCQICNHYSIIIL